jgi:hypothetical protein
MLHQLILKASSEPATAVAIFAALVALLSGVFAPTVQLIIGWRQTKAARITALATQLTAELAGDRAIATMRLDWMQRVRETLSEFHSILMTATDPLSDDDNRKLSHLGTKLDLLLNLDEPIQYELWSISDRIFNEEDREKRAQMDPALMKAGRVVMKREWEKVKHELRGDNAA